MSQGARLELPLPGRPAAEGGALVVFVGRTDFTSLFVADGDRLVYEQRILPLPVGTTDVTVYLAISEREWRRVASFPLRVEDPAEPATKSHAESRADSVPAGTQASADSGITLLPSAAMTVGFTGQINQEQSGSGPATQQASGSGTLQTTVRHRVVRGPFSSESRLELAGASRQEEALRFSERGDAAPQLDLSSYEVLLRRRAVALQVGHFSFGTNRHLINAFASRGVTLRLPMRRHVDLSLAAMSATNVVGFSNVLGIGRRRHRVVSGTAGLEVIPGKPGMLRVEVSGLRGSVLPEAGFGEGSITDAEESRGYAARVLAGGPAERFQVEAGLTVSRFDNPGDPLLQPGDSLTSGGVSIVPVEATTDHAHFLDARLDVLRDVRLGGNRTATLTAGYRHERVDPLFRSVAASVQGDRLQHDFELTGALGEITIGASHGRSRDNLDQIPTLLTTLTRRTGLSAGVPLTTVLASQARPAAWLPVLAYALDRTHQFAGSVPVGEQFQDPSFIPDQVSTNHTLTVSWQGERWKASYSFNRSAQDNRQPGRELADLTNTVNGVSFGLTPTGAFDLALELSVERARNQELDRTDRTYRAGSSVTWRFDDASVLAANLAVTASNDSPLSATRRNFQIDAQLSRSVPLGRWLGKAVQGQLLLRVAAESERSDDVTLGVADRVRRWTGSAGWSLTLP